MVLTSKILKQIIPITERLILGVQSCHFYTLPSQLTKLQTERNGLKINLYVLESYYGVHILA